MEWPKFLKFTLPKFKFRPQMPKIFTSSFSFYTAWKKFIRQIPPESRSIIKSYQHFIVLGNEKGGKSELIQGVIEQSQDLYPFDTSYTEAADVQFYLGPRHVIQEISFAALENKSIKVRKQIIRLWKKLYARRTPIILIAYDCSSQQLGDLRELNKLAQLIAGKISLLAEIGKRPLKTRVALTFLDKVPGYLEFARFLKQQNIGFSINLSSNFESNTLAAHLKQFSEEHLSLILTSVSHEDYGKILTFFKEMPLIFPMVEEFLRALVTRVSFKGAIEIDMLSLTSNKESSTSFVPFQWTKLPSSALFFRHPLLKHQLTAVCLFLVTFSLLLNSFFKSRSELQYIARGIDLLDLLQFNAFQEKIVHEYDDLEGSAFHPLLSIVDPYFFTQKLHTAKDQLAHRIRKHLIETEFRKAILENKAELKYLYFVGLMRATSFNHMGKFILKNSHEWAQALKLDESLLKLYINCCLEQNSSPLLNENKSNAFLPLTSLSPWFSFLKKYKEINEQPIFAEQAYEEINKETEKLLLALSRLRNDPLVFGIATLLDEEGLRDNENIKTVHWVGENVDALENFLLFLKQVSPPQLNVQGMNLSQLFVKVKGIATLAQTENELYNFTLNDHLFSFESNTWINHIVAHHVEKALQEYVVLNADSEGAIFFNNLPESQPPTASQFQELIPFFKVNFMVPGRYSRIDYERKVRTAAEKLAVFIDSLNIHVEEKKRFTNFLVKETINYIKNFQKNYVVFFDSCEMQTNSINDLKKLLSDLTKPTCDFYEFLRIIQHQNSGFSDPILSLKNMEGLNEFDFLNNVLTQNNGKALIEEYQQLMGQLLNELEADIHTPLSQSSFILDPISPAERMSLDILQNNPSSYLRKVHECLAQMGIPERFYEPFNKPVMLLYKIGLKELKLSIEHCWKTHIYLRAASIFSKFPFNLQAEQMATFDEMNTLLNPKSEHYQALEKVMASCCVYKDGVWLPIDANSLDLDQQIYDQFNMISKVSHTLWDDEGSPKPLAVKISSVPFDGKDENLGKPIVTYFITGTQSLYNFNQDPSWQPLNIEWWKNDLSFIGIELVNKDSNSKSYRNIQAPQSLWSFFCLLKKGEQKDNTWSWTLPAREDQGSYTVSFLFEIDPQKLISIPKNP